MRYYKGIYARLSALVNLSLHADTALHPSACLPCLPRIFPAFFVSLFVLICGKVVLCILHSMFLVITLRMNFLLPPILTMARFPACQAGQLTGECCLWSWPFRSGKGSSTGGISRYQCSYQWSAMARTSTSILECWKRVDVDMVNIGVLPRDDPQKYTFLCEAFVASCLCRWSNFKMVVSYLYPCSSKKSTEDSPGFCL